MSKVEATYQKHSERTCIACKTAAGKRELVRFVRDANGDVSLDSSSRAAGRGAYLCGAQGCFDKARTKTLLDRALRVHLSTKDYDRLEAEYRLVGANIGQNPKSTEV